MCFRPPEVTTEELICPQCGGVNRPGDADCFQCGASLAGVSVGAGANAFADGSAVGAPPVPGVPSVPGAPKVPKPPTVPAAPSVPKP